MYWVVNNKSTHPRRADAIAHAQSLHAPAKIEVCWNTGRKDYADCLKIYHAATVGADGSVYNESQLCFE